VQGLPPRRHRVIACRQAGPVASTASRRHRSRPSVVGGRTRNRTAALWRRRVHRGRSASRHPTSLGVPGRFILGHGLPARGFPASRSSFTTAASSVPSNLPSGMYSLSHLNGKGVGCRFDCKSPGMQVTMADTGLESHQKTTR
jgi:hypothetical protein